MHEINVFRRNRGEIDVHIDPVGRILSQLAAPMALDFSEEFQYPVEGERFADPPVAAAAGDDRRTVDRERNSGGAHEHFGLELALFVGIVEAVVDGIVLIGGTDETPGDVGGSDVMELLHVEKLGEFHHVFGAVEVDPIGFAGRILAEVDVRGAVENDIRSGEQRMFGELLRHDGGHVTFDHLDRTKNFVGDFRTAVERAFVANDLLRPLFGAFHRRFAG